MTTWIALLRGVNVGGITVRSAELAEVFRGLGFEDVKTFLASGNVRFDTAETGRAALKGRIEAALRDRFGYEAWIVLITRAELERAIAAFPFDATDGGRQPYVVFGSDPAALRRLTDAAADLDPAADPVTAGDGVIYWNPVKGTTLDSPFGRLLGRAEFKSTTTNRNLRTLVKIAG
jgi:uncharacterized protein (DUF1697 family)